MYDYCLESLTLVYLAQWNVSDEIQSLLVMFTMSQLQDSRLL